MNQKSPNKENPEMVAFFKEIKRNYPKRQFESDIKSIAAAWEKQLKKKNK